MSSMCTLDTQLLLTTLADFRNGDFSVRLPATGGGTTGEIAAALNGIFRLNEELADQLERVSEPAARKGNATPRACLPGRGRWGSCGDSINSLAATPSQPISHEAAGAGRPDDERHPLALMAAQLGVFDYDPRKGQFAWLDAARHFGAAEAAGVGYETFLGGIHADDRVRVDELIQAALRGRSGGRFAAEFRTESETGMWLSA